MPACETSTQFGHGFMNTSPECAACMSLSQDSCKSHGRSASSIAASYDIAYTTMRPQQRAHFSASEATAVAQQFAADMGALSQSCAPAAANRCYFDADTGL